MRKTLSVFAVGLFVLNATAWPGTTRGAWYAKFDGVDGTSANVAVGEQFGVVVGSDTELSPPGQTVASYTFELAFGENLMQLGVLDQIFDSPSVTVVPTATGIQVTSSGVAPSSVGDYARITFQAIAGGQSIVTLASFTGIDSNVPPQPLPPQAINPSTLMISVVPEPSAIAIGMLASSAVMFIRRRRNFT
jgi:hypothetical protein